MSPSLVTYGVAPSRAGQNMLADLDIEEMQKGRDDLSGDGSQIDLDNMF